MSTGSVAFDRAADFYDQTRGFPPGEAQPIAALISEAGHLTPTSRVLEIGVGTGRIALPLVPHTGSYFGVDLSRLMMEHLRANQTGKSVFVAQADVTRLPFASQTFDAAIASHVFHLIPGLQDALREIARVLRPDAALVHCWGGGDPIFQMARAALPAEILNEARATVGVPREQITTFLESEGWQPASDILAHSYSYERIPQHFVDQIRRRVWSSTWRLSDEALAQYAAAVQNALNAVFSDPGEPVTVTATFRVRAYRPPP